jgi:hypothetical protein
MKILLDVKDSKAGFVMELLRNLSYVKTKTLTASKAQLLSEMNDAVEEVKLAKKGKKKLKSFDEFLNEL